MSATTLNKICVFVFQGNDAKIRKKKTVKSG